MQSGRGLYPEGWRVMKLCLPYAAMAVVGEYVIQAIKEVTSIGSGLTFASVVIWSFLAYAAHATLLLPADRDKSLEGKRMFSFALRTFGLMLIVIGLAFVPLTPTLLSTFELDDATGRNEMVIMLILLLIPIAALLWLLVFGLLGTLLPAFVADRQRGFATALARGRRQFFWTLGRLTIGPGVFFCLSLPFFFLPVLLFESEGNFLLSSYLPDPATTLPALLGYSLQSYATVLAAVVLSRAFLRDEARTAAQAV